MKARWLRIFGERSLTLIGALFPDFASADAAQRSLKRDAALVGEVMMIGPDDRLTAMKIEPEQKGIWGTLWRSHVVLGVGGFLLGLLASAALWASGWSAARLKPGYTTLFITVLFSFAGGMLGGLLTLRPDHARVIGKLRRALNQRQWAVVVRPTRAEHAALAMEPLQQLGAGPLRSF